MIVKSFGTRSPINQTISSQYPISFIMPRSLPYIHLTLVLLLLNISSNCNKSTAYDKIAKKQLVPLQKDRKLPMLSQLKYMITLILPTSVLAKHLKKLVYNE